MCKYWVLALVCAVLPAHAGRLYTALIERVDNAGGSKVGQVTLWPAADTSVAWVVRDKTSGTTVPHRVVWHRSDEPMLLSFDASSGSTDYTIEAWDEAGTPHEWLPRTGLMVETRHRPIDTPDTADTWEEALSLWERAGESVGRSFATQVFSGLPPHGVASDFIVRFDGWLQIAQAGEYAFATASDDASFLSVDGHRVAVWPGQHAPHEGVFGKHHGVLRLERGVYRFEYLNVEFASGYQVLAAWRPPDAKYFKVIPAAAFAPIDTFTVRSVTSDTTAVPLVAWQHEGFAVAGTTVLYDVRLWLPGGAGDGAARWMVDDGLSALGDDVRHVFVGERVANVTCEIWRDGKRAGRMSQPVRMQRNPSQREETPEVRLRALLRAATLPNVLRKRTPKDLCALFSAADATDDSSLADIAETLFERRHACVGPLAEGLYALGFYYQRPGLRDHGRVDAVWSAVIEDPLAEEGLRARTGLHLAGFLIHSGLGVARGMRLFETMASDAALTEGDRRLKLIFIGDGRLMLGDRVGAIVALRQAGRAVADDDTHYEVRRRVRLEAARHYLVKKEYAAAERVIRELEWEWPLERLNLETGLLMLDIYRGRGALDFALAAAKRLLAGAPADPARPDLLLAMASIQHTLKRETDFSKTLQHLRREYPYSEAVALAADRYPTNE